MPRFCCIIIIISPLGAKSPARCLFYTFSMRPPEPIELKFYIWHLGNMKNTEFLKSFKSICSDTQDCRNGNHPKMIQTTCPQNNKSDEAET